MRTDVRRALHHTQRCRRTMPVGATARPRQLSSRDGCSSRRFRTRLCSWFLMAENIRRIYEVSLQKDVISNRSVMMSYAASCFFSAEARARSSLSMSFDEMIQGLSANTWMPASMDATIRSRSSHGSLPVNRHRVPAVPEALRPSSSWYGYPDPSGSGHSFQSLNREDYRFESSITPGQGRVYAARSARDTDIPSAAARHGRWPGSTPSARRVNDFVRHRAGLPRTADSGSEH